MALDYRTPCPRTPIDTTTKFVPCGNWTAQTLSPYEGSRGDWIIRCERVSRAAVIEWAMGYSAGLRTAARLLGLEKKNVEWEVIWIVGPTGHGYFSLEIPPIGE